MDTVFSFAGFRWLWLVPIELAAALVLMGLFIVVPDRRSRLGRRMTLFVAVVLLTSVLAYSLTYWTDRGYTTRGVAIPITLACGLLWFARRNLLLAAGGAWSASFFGMLVGGDLLFSLHGYSPGAGNYLILGGAGMMDGLYFVPFMVFATLALVLVLVNAAQVNRAKGMPWSEAWKTFPPLGEVLIYDFVPSRLHEPDA